MESKTLHFDEPHITGGNCHVTLTEQQAIKSIKKIHHYDNDEEALLDFIAIHWAYYNCSRCRK